MSGITEQEHIQKVLGNNTLRHKLYVIVFQSNTAKGKAFNVALILCILFSITIVIIESLSGIPPYVTALCIAIEYIVTLFFTLEYITRIYCSPKPLKYIFSFFGIIDLLATFPLYLVLFFPGARYLLIFRTFRLIQIFRVFKLFSFMKEGQMLFRSLKQSRKKIIVFFLFVLIMAISLGTLMYMFESPHNNAQFNNIPNSIYWSIVTMTTVGYGDIAPVTGAGKALSAFVMLLGYTIIAVPTGIISASMIKEYKHLENRTCSSCHQTGHEEHALYCKHCGEKLNNNSPLS